MDEPLTGVGLFWNLDPIIFLCVTYRVLAMQLTLAPKTLGRHGMSLSTYVPRIQKCLSKENRKSTTNEAYRTILYITVHPVCYPQLQSAQPIFKSESCLHSVP